MRGYEFGLGALLRMSETHRFIAALFCLLLTVPAWGQSNRGNVPYPPAGGAAYYLIYSNCPVYPTDATSCIQGALNTVSAAGGGVLYGAPSFRYAVSNLTIPTHVSFVGNWAPGGYSGAGCYNADPNTLVVSGTITQSADSSLYNWELLSSGVAALPCPSDMRSMVNIYNAFAGTAVTIGGNDTYTQNLFILGFGTAISSTNRAQHHVNNIEGDNNAGIIIDGQHDTSFFNDIHWWNYLAGNAYSSISYSISAVSNSAGLVQITTTAPTPLITGDVVNIAGATVFTALNTRWTITVSDSTHFTLNGSAFTSVTPTCTSVNGSTQLTSVSSLAQVVIGQSITKADIPGGATVIYINDVAKKIILDAAHAATGSSTSACTITMGTYGASGVVYVSAGWHRSGAGFAVTNSEYTPLSNYGAFGYQIGFHAGTGSGWATVSNIGVDDYLAAADPTTQGFVMDSTAYALTITGGFIGPYGESIQVNDTYASGSSSSAGKIMGVSIPDGIGNGPYGIGLMNGSLVMSGDAFRSPNIYIADAASGLHMSANEPGNASFSLESAANCGLAYNFGAPITGCTNVAQFTGTAPNRGVILGVDIGGTGGFSTNKHDATTTGGNAIGTNAQDLQIFRSAATQVASGTESFAAGGANTASNTGAVAIGFGNTVSSIYGMAAGNSNVVSGSYGSAPGGVQANDRGRYAAQCFSSSGTNVTGDSQTCKQVLRGTNSGATAGRLTADAAAAGAANVFNIPNASAFGLTIYLHARDHTTSGKDFDWTMTGAMLTRDANVASTAFVAGTISILPRGTVTGAGVTATADTTNGGLNVSFTPPSGNTDTWDISATIASMEVQ